MEVDICTKCPSRSICSDLCPEAALYVKQDEVKQRELNIGLPNHSGKWPDYVEKAPFTKMERKILHALIDGKTRKEISKLLNISRETLRKHLENIRSKREEITPNIEE